MRAISSGPTRATTRRPTASPTSRRSARPAAMKSSSCTAPPTARRWPRSTRRTTPATSKRSCSTRSCRRTGPNRSTAPTFAAVPAHPAPAVRAARLRAHHARTPSPISRASSGAWAGAAARALDRRPRARAHDALSSNELLEMLVEGDLEPTLRAEFPAAVALGGARRHGAAGAAGQSGSQRRRRSRSPAKTSTTPLYYATTCEEQAFPWSRAPSPDARLAEAERRRTGAAARARSRPSPRPTCSTLSDIPACAFWPFTTPAPAPTHAPFPSVPTLILSGADDLRTPTANAREVAAQIPGPTCWSCPTPGTRCSAPIQPPARATPCRRCSQASRSSPARRRRRRPTAPDAAAAGAPGRRSRPRRATAGARTHAARGRADARRLRPPAGAAATLSGSTPTASPRCPRCTSAVCARAGPSSRRRAEPARLLLRARRDVSGTIRANRASCTWAAPRPRPARCDRGAHRCWSARSAASAWRCRRTRSRRRLSSAPMRRPRS